MVYRQTEKTRLRNEQRRRDIKSAARSLFAERGYNSTTMKQIVTRAGTSTGNVYFYFRNKAELLNEIVMEVIADFWKVDVTGSMQAEAMKLALVLYHGLREMLVNKETAHLMLIGNTIPAIRQAMFENFIERVLELVDSAPDLFQGVNARLAINSTYGSEIWILERVRSGEIEYDVHEICLFHVRWTMQAIGLSSDIVEHTIRDLIRHESLKAIIS